MAHAPDSIALRVPHPEWGVAKDVFLLAYKFGNFEKENGDYFLSNLERIFQDKGHFRVLQGLSKFFDFLVESKPKIDKQQEEMTFEYDFKFQEIFSEKEKVLQCIKNAEDKLDKIYKKVF